MEACPGTSSRNMTHLPCDRDVSDEWALQDPPALSHRGVVLGAQSELRACAPVELASMSQHRAAVIRFVGSCHHLGSVSVSVLSDHDLEYKDARTSRSSGDTLTKTISFNSPTLGCILAEAKSALYILHPGI